LFITIVILGVTPPPANLVVETDVGRPNALHILRK